MFQQRESITGEYPAFKGKEIGGTLTLFIQIPGVKEFYRQIKNKVKIVSELHKQPYTSAEFAIEDCNGYILAFAEVDSK